MFDRPALAPRFDVYGNAHYPNTYGLYPQPSYTSYDGVRVGATVRCKNGRTATVVDIRDLLLAGKVQYMVRYIDRQKGQKHYGYLYRHHIIEVTN